jgi:putative redox protein
MKAKVNWQGRMTFDGSADSGFHVQLGTDPSVGGDNDGVRPMELLAIGLAGCTAMDVISILTKKRQEVTGFEVEAHVDRAHQHPKVFTRATLEYIVVGRNVEEEAVLRAIELSAEIYCSAQAMFKQLMPLELNYTIYEDLGDGERLLKANGSYQLQTQPVR